MALNTIFYLVRNTVINSSNAGPSDIPYNFVVRGGGLFQIS